MAQQVRPCDGCGIDFTPSRKGQRFHSRKCQLSARNKPRKQADLGQVHIIIPDTQAKPGAPSNHLRWIGKYINDRYSLTDIPVSVIHLGDHWDMPSLSSYDRGKKSMEGRRYLKDIAAGNRAMEVLSEPFANVECRRILLRGNHEDRITRAIESDAQLDGLLSLDDLKSPGWEVVDFLTPFTLDGVVYSHYFYNPMTGNPYSGAAATRLKTLGHSFTMGHQQTLDYSLRFVNGRSQHGLVAGACYLHDEDYKGPQGNAHWRGIIVCHNVENGSYDPMFVSLDYLCRRYEGVRLADFQGKEL